MQYILTQEEYDALKREQRATLTSNKKKLQELATQAAQHIPVKVSWDRTAPPAPWGCILDPNHQHTGYCDQCPAQIICPNEGKEYSK